MHNFPVVKQVRCFTVLHTWGQNLSLHPHLHCIVPGGGVDDKEKWKQRLRSDKYLFPAKARSNVFRARYLAGLRDSGIENKALLESLFQKQWLVFAKRPFGGPVQVIEYLWPLYAQSSDQQPSHYAGR
jgi:hypothetical protein